MSAESMDGGRALTVAGNPAKDREESDKIMRGLWRLNGDDGTMQGD